MNNDAKLVIKTDLANFFCYELNEMNYGSFIVESTGKCKFSKNA